MSEISEVVKQKAAEMEAENDLVAIPRGLLGAALAVIKRPDFNSDNVIELLRYYAYTKKAPGPLRSRAEPVGEVVDQPDGLVMDGTVHLGGNGTHRAIKGLNKMKRMPLGTKFYTAPPASPAPVVPEPVSQPYKLSEGWIACSEQCPEREYVLAADFSGAYYPPSLPNTQVGIYADWFEDGKPSWDDGDGNDLHLKQVTHWMPMPAAPQQE